MQVIGVKEKRSMSKIIQYSDEPLGEMKIVPDHLPSPAELAKKNENTKVTISLSSESVAYFKAVAKENHMQYQITNLHSWSHTFKFLIELQLQHGNPLKRKIHSLHLIRTPSLLMNGCCSSH